MHEGEIPVLPVSCSFSVSSPEQPQPCLKLNLAAVPKSTPPSCWVCAAVRAAAAPSHAARPSAPCGLPHVYQK